jgi:hypothetical protein
VLATESGSGEEAGAGATSAMTSAVVGSGSSAAAADFRVVFFAAVVFFVRGLAVALVVVAFAEAALVFAAGAFLLGVFFAEAESSSSKGWSVDSVIGCKSGEASVTAPGDESGETGPALSR